MTKSQSRQEDDRRSEGVKTRMEKTHGGELVEAVSQEELESFNDAECKHEKLVPDPSETDFDGYTCANPDCNVVLLYDKKK